MADYLLVVSLAGYLVYRALENTHESVKMEGACQKLQNGLVRGWDEASNEYLSPTATTSRAEQTQPMIKREMGPFGVPRIIRKTSGGYNVPNFGDGMNFW